MRLMQTVFSDAVLFLGVKQMQIFKFNTLLLQRLANSMSSVDKLIVSAWYVSVYVLSAETCLPNVCVCSRIKDILRVRGYHFRTSKP